MAFVKSFCFYFSCRLGSLIVGVFNIIQILLWLSLCIHCLIHSQEISERVAELLDDEELDLSDISDSLNNIKNSPEKCFSWGITFFTIFCLSCIAMMYGVYKLKSYIVYPFVVIDFFYITTLLVVYVIGLLILKTNGQGLGPLILFSVMGEFLFLYKYYTWFVVLSYCQIIYDLKKEETSTINFKITGQPNGKTMMYPNDLSLPPYPEYAMYPKKY